MDVALGKSLSATRVWECIVCRLDKMVGTTRSTTTMVMAAILTSIHMAVTIGFTETILAQLASVKCAKLESSDHVDSVNAFKQFQETPMEFVPTISFSNGMPNSVTGMFFA